jgi:hypothetical protein
LPELALEDSRRFLLRVGDSGFNNNFHDDGPVIQ